MSKLYTCTKCGKKKQPNEFSIRNSRPSGRNSWCKSCVSERDKEYYQHNREKILERQKQYDSLHKEEKRERNLQYQKDNAEKLNEYNRQYYSDNKERILPVLNERKMRKNAKKLDATPKWLSNQHIADMKSIYKACKKISDKTGVKHEVDHIIPLISDIVCGLHVPWNLQILPKSQNASKRNKLIDEDIV